MIRALPAPLGIPLRSLFVVGWLALNVALLAHPGVRYLMSAPHDWSIWTGLQDKLATGTLYDWSDGSWFVWSPIAAWLLAYVFAPLGYSFWVALHLALVPVLRSWSLAALTVVSVPFWVDTLNGNTVVFAFVAGALALHGSRAGAFLSLALFAVMPRPLMLPLVLWLLWRRPETRVPFALMSAVTLAVALAAGYLDDWLTILIGLAGANNEHFANLSPSAFIGSAWLILGIPLAAWLTVKGRVGVAGLAMSPYVLPMYPLVLLWEWIERPSLSGSPDEPDPLMTTGDRQPTAARPR